MSKKITVTEEQLAAFVASAVAKANGSASEPARAKRSLSFVAYDDDGEKAAANAVTFANALGTGKGAAAMYAHASMSKRGVSAAAIREILAEPAVRSAVRAFIATLG